MKRKKFLNILILLGAILLLFIATCEYDGPDPLYPPSEDDIKNYPDPVIERIEPPSNPGPSITIYGDNFSTVLQENSVYFNNVKVRIKKASKTEILVARPALIGDDITISVVVKDAVTIPKFSPYVISDVKEKISEFKASDIFYAICIDGDDNLYGNTRNKIVYKLTPEKVASEFASVSFRAVNELRAGSKGDIFLSREKTAIHKLPADGGAMVDFISCPIKVMGFDFDKNKNAYVGGDETGIAVVNADGQSKVFPYYEEFEITCIRVFEDYVYSIAGYTGEDETIPLFGVWRNKILDDKGELDEAELYLDWSTTGSFAEATMNAMTFSLSGDLYIATDNDPDPILVMHPDLSVEPFYETILTTPAVDIVWGNDNYMYMLQGDNGMIKIFVGEPGAPNYTRLLF